MSDAALDLYWIPLGAGTPVVRASGRLYEAATATVQRRPRRDLYHSALIATLPAAALPAAALPAAAPAPPARPIVIEMTPIPDDRGRLDRGVVGEGPVGSRWLRRFRVFRYEIRCWPGGVIPDLAFAVDSPVHLASDPALVAAVPDLVRAVPTPVWGRDELGAGEMWNSNSVISWVLTRAGIGGAGRRPPGDGRAPGWDAGVRVAESTAA